MKNSKELVCLSALALSGTIYAQDQAKPRVGSVSTPVIDVYAAAGRRNSDNDKDGFDDLWYRAFASGAENPLQLEEDPDGDGKSNYQEMVLFQDPLTWTNYRLEGAGSEKLADSRRASYVHSVGSAPIQTPGGADTVAKEGAEIQKVSENLSPAYAKWQKERRDVAEADTRGINLKTDSDLPGVATNLTGSDSLGRPLFTGGFDTNANVQTLVDQLQPGGSLGLNLDGSPLGLTQTERSIDIWDGGVARTTHVDLQGTSGTRVGNLDGSGVSEHSTQMAGIIGGSGFFDDGLGNLSLGAATGAKLNMSNLNLDFSEMLARPLGASRVSNHSYGQLMGWNAVDIGVGVPVLAWLGDIGISTAEDFDFGRYSYDSQVLDLIALNKPWTLQIRSAGNDRGASESMAGWTAAGAQKLNIDGQTGFYYTSRNGTAGLFNGSRFYPSPVTNGVYVSVSGTPPSDGASNFDTLPPTSTAKNLLTIGGVDNTASVASFTAFGPTDDGRVKPDIVTPGVNIFTASSTSDSGTASSTGTSPAAAIASGALALLNQHQENLWGPKFPLPAASVKALAIHTAQEIGTDGPNYDSGYGLLQAADAATTIESNYHAENTDANGKLIKLHTFIKELVIPESEWISIDLGADLATTGVEINWSANYASGFVIEGATSAAPNAIITLATGYGSVGGVEAISWASTNIRYIRLVALTRARPDGISINEFSVKNGATVLSVGKTATSSSSIGAANLASSAVDGSLTTRWASIYAGVTEYPWVQLDLASATSFNKAVITWDSAYASEFLLEGSASLAGPYTQIGSTNVSTGGTTTVSFSAVNYRYVRLVAQRLATTSGVAIKEFQIFNGATLLSSGAPAIANSRSSSSFAATLVTDGNLSSTRWQSASPGSAGAQFPLKAAGGPIRATAVWADPVGAMSPSALDSSLPSIINDIDLRVFRSATSGVRLETKPWRLNPASPASAATRGDNFRDNIEQVETASAVANSAYSLELRPKMNRRVIGRQKVSLTITGVQQIPLMIFQELSTVPVFDTPNNQVIVTEAWTTIPGEVYRVEWSSDLVNWTAFSGDYPAIGDVTSAVFTVSPAPSSMFFRFITVPPNPFNIP